MTVGERREGVVVGFDYHARYLARVINRHSARWRLQAFSSSRAGTLRALWALRRADVLIAFGGPGPSVALTEAAQWRRLPVVVVWAGTDVLLAAEQPFDMAVTRRRGYDNVAVAPWLVDELRAIGVEATHVRVGAIDIEETVAPLPPGFSVLTYLPAPRREFYGESPVYAIAGAMPDVPFTVLGPGERNPAAPANVHFAGHVDDVAARIDASTVLLRLTEHDGASVLVLEALGRARHVVWTHAFPCVHAVNNTNEALVALRRLREAHDDGRLEPNDAGRAFVRRNFSPPDIAADFSARLDAIVSTAARGRNGKRHRVAISGLGLFSAEVAANVERLHPEWKASVLSLNSRAETLAAMLTVARSELLYSIGSPSDRWIDLCARMLRKPRVVHWVGSDIEYLRHQPALRKRLVSRRIKHLAEVDWTARELRDLGLRSQIAPLPLRHHTGAVKPLPQRFTVLLYLPKSRPDFYGRKELETMLHEVAGDDVRVLVVGGGTLSVPTGTEVVNLGWRDDLRDVYESSTVLIRFTPRDGLALMVLEALSYGRYVMWSKPFPYAIQIQNAGDMVAALSSLLSRHRAGTLQAQYAAAGMIQQRYSAERAADGILRAWESVR